MLAKLAVRYSDLASVQGGCRHRWCPERHHGWQVLGPENAEAASKSWGCRRAALTGAGPAALSYLALGHGGSGDASSVSTPGMHGQARAESEHALLCTGDASSL